MNNDFIRAAPLPQGASSNIISANGNSGLEKYDFMSAGEVSSYLGIGKSQAYEICKQINQKLAAEGYLTFRGKVPRRALLDALPRQSEAR